MAEKSPNATSPAASQWSRWYSENPDKIESCLKPALNEVDKTRAALTELNLGEGERASLAKVTTLQEFLDVVTTLEQEHKSKKKFQAFQQNLVTFQKFAETYSPFVQALREAPPFGAGHLIWGVCAMVVTTAANKQSKEQATTESLDKISRSLPRLDVYRELYPTGRMIHLVSQLYAITLRYLLRVFTYYKKSTWKGSIARILVVMSPSRETVDPLVVEIDKVSQDIKDEGTLGLSAEVRDTRLATQKVQNKVNENTGQILDLKTRLKDSEEREARLEISRIKNMFVPTSYDPQEVHDVASRQINRIDRDTVQIEACQTLLSSLPLFDWRTQPNSSSETRSKTIATEFKMLWWVTSSDFDDPTISYVAHDAIKSLTGFNGGPKRCSHITILHSLYQTSEACCQTNSPDRKRTISSVLMEAIYQLLDRHPQLIWSNEQLKAHCRGENIDQLNFEGLGSILRDLFQSTKAHPRNQSKEANLDRIGGIGGESVPVLWVIDRVDELRFRGRDAGRLTKLISLVHQIAQDQRGRLRVLLTSRYDLSRLDDRWSESEEAATIVESKELVHFQYGVE